MLAGYVEWGLSSLPTRRNLRRVDATPCGAECDQRMDHRSSKGGGRNDTTDFIQDGMDGSP